MELFHRPGIPLSSVSVRRIAAVRRQAFDDLIVGYWKPVYKHLRITWRLSDEDAQDLTQAFFSEAFQKEWLERYEPGRARFRTFVRVCADRLVMNWKQSASRGKRGGGIENVPLDFAEAERELQAAYLSTPADADDSFRREFIRALFDRAVAAVRDEYERAGQKVHLPSLSPTLTDSSIGISSPRTSWSAPSAKCL